MAKASFQKFIDKSLSGAKLKEQIRQQKKKQRQETKEYFEEKKKAAREGRASTFEDKSQKAQQSGGKRISGGVKASSRKDFPSTTKRDYNPGRKKNFSSNSKNEAASHTKKDFTPHSRKGFTEPARKEGGPGKKPITPIKKSVSAKPVESKKPAISTEQMPLNKYISHAGICSRRDAAELVCTGKVSVNGTVISEPGFKVSEKDEVKLNGKRLFPARNQVYILLNKPKDYITTMEDPEGRKTVYDIIRAATPERVYPVGRLDRNTTGVLIFTNDGELAQKLSHPSYEVRKIYEVKLDKPLIKKDFDAILSGIQLEDGKITPDSLAYADSKDKSVIGIEIHSGRNRIVRRIFETLGYDVRNLDRVMYANLTKKNVDRGKWRYLSEKEVRLLKFMNASYAKKKENRKV